MVVLSWMRPAPVIGALLVVASGCYPDPTYMNYVELRSLDGQDFVEVGGNCFMVNDHGHPYGTDYVNSAAQHGDYMTFTQREGDGVVVRYYVTEPSAALDEGDNHDFQLDFTWDELSEGTPKTVHFELPNSDTSPSVRYAVTHYGSRGDCAELDPDFEIGTEDGGPTSTSGEPINDSGE